MRTLIIYASQSGKTEVVAKTLSNKLNTDIIKINDLKNRTGYKNRVIATLDAFREVKTDIQPMRVDVSDYDLIYFGTPTWASKPSPAIITIIDRCDLRGKDVILFATMSNSGGAATIERMEEKVKARGARVIETFTLKTKGKNKEQLIQDSETVVEILDLNMYSNRI